MTIKSDLTAPAWVMWVWIVLGLAIPYLHIMFHNHVFAIVYAFVGGAIVGVHAEARRAKRNRKEP